MTSFPVRFLPRRLLLRRVNDQTDLQLMRAYGEQRSEAAFAELVSRYVNLVYSAARRMVHDVHLAEDVTQAVFVALAKNTEQLPDRLALSGWLHRTGQNIAAQTVRTDVRRRAREQEAAAMKDLIAVESEAPWERIAPHLDAALGELSEPDHDVVLLRYFEGKSAREIAQTLSTSEEAAQKRVSRAVERLRAFFAKRGVSAGASGLVVIISANAVQAASPDSPPASQWSPSRAQPLSPPQLRASQKPSP
jgi:RNA polymerase sigma factor (sigma-70 family)